MKRLKYLTILNVNYYKYLSSLYAEKNEKQKSRILNFYVQK